MVKATALGYLLVVYEHRAVIVHHSRRHCHGNKFYRAPAVFLKQGKEGKDMSEEDLCQHVDEEKPLSSLPTAPQGEKK